MEHILLDARAIRQAQGVLLTHQDLAAIGALAQGQARLAVDGGNDQRVEDKRNRQRQEDRALRRARRAKRAKLTRLRHRLHTQTRQY